MPPLKSIALILLVATGANALAQSSIDRFNATYVSTSSLLTAYTHTPASGSGSFNGCGGNNFDYEFNKGSDNGWKLLDFIAGGKNFFIANTTSPKVVLRRVNNATVTGNRTVVSIESATAASACPWGGKLDSRLPYKDAMEDFLASNFLNQGTDNLFTNTGNGDGNNNNIERVDILFPSGLSSVSATDAGFAIFDRGANRGHDGFRIAAITSLDVNGDPASFGVLKTCVKGNSTSNGNWGHPSSADGNKTLSTYVMRKEGNEAKLRASAAINGQQIGGVFFSFADLGIAAGQKIYGYSLFSTDGLANPSSAQLLNINDPAVYPTNTTESYGGLDMMTVSAVFSSGGTPLAVSAAELKRDLSASLPVLNWKVYPLETGSHASLEMSENGRDYRMIYRLSVQNGIAVGRYTSAAAATCYYRIRISSPTGSVQYSNTVKIEGGQQDVSFYPNLVMGQDRTVLVRGFKDGSYDALLTDIQGRVYTTRFAVTGGTGRVVLPSGLSGMAWLQFSDVQKRVYKGGKILFQ
jgi:hypothetical protein